MPPEKFMLIAGEASGDTLGAELVEALKARVPSLEFFGAGGPRMGIAGVHLHLDLAKHAVVGIWEVLKNYGKFKKFFDDLLALAEAEKPDAIILIDYPGFNLRFAKALKKRTAHGDWKPRIIYYVSPQIWAWHESRVHQISRDIDLLLSIFPFEKTWYAERVPNFRVEFVGHPLMDRFSWHPPALSKAEPSSPAQLLLLPGSREREVRKHLPVMLKAAEILGRQTAVEPRLVVPSEPLQKLAETLMAGSRLPTQIGGLAEALVQADLAFASSGTVTMECAYFGVPTVVLYKTSWTTYALAKCFIRVPYVAMPNLLAGSMIYPEFLQEAATPQALAAEGLELVNNRKRRGVVQSELRKVIKSLGPRGASERSADAVLKLWGF